MGASSIEWTNETWNPVRGCTIVSPGCSNCYAMRQAHRFSGEGRPYARLTKLGGRGPVWTGDVRLVPEELVTPLSWRQPRKVFVNSMSDLFHENVPFDFIAAVFGVMAATPQHTYQVLTKRPERMIAFFEWAASQDVTALFFCITRAEVDIVCSDRRMTRHETNTLVAASGLRPMGQWPLPNVWLGVSVENQKYADERIPLLLKTPAAVRFLSCEPLLGPVDLNGLKISPVCHYCHKQPLASAISRDERCDCCAEGAEPIDWGALHWVIVGGESGNGARPMLLDWARSLVEQCRTADVAVFVKQLGRLPAMSIEPTGRFRGPPGTSARQLEVKVVTLGLKSSKGKDMDEWPADLRVREFPEGR